VDGYDLPRPARDQLVPKGKARQHHARISRLLALAHDVLPRFDSLQLIGQREQRLAVRIIERHPIIELAQHGLKRVDWLG
jgi:hypothetical protein